jgi:hypothetical protein
MKKQFNSLEHPSIRAGVQGVFEQPNEIGSLLQALPASGRFA